MRGIDDSGNRQRWIIRLLLVLAVIVGVAAYRKETRGETEASTGSGRARGAKLSSTAGDLERDPASARTGAIRLPPIATGTLRLEGIVVDQDEHPVGGAHVSLGGRRDATTEADGSFAFDGLAEGDYDLAADHGDWFAETQGNTLSDTSEPITIKLERGPTLVVTVTDGARPLAGAKVNIISRERLTGADGIARFRAVALDDEVLTVSMAGHANVRERITTSDDPKRTIERTIVLRSGAQITGTVVDRSGARVIDAYVDLEPVAGGLTNGVWTDDKGTFLLADIGKGAYVAKASSKDTIAAEPITITHDGVHAVTGLVLRVEPGGEIAGIVVDTAGHPVPEARVSGSSVGETTDKDGRFVAKGLLPDKYEISASTPTLGAANQVITLARGEHATIRIVVTPSSLAGVVVDARGEPVEGATVFARSENPDTYGYGRSDEHGHFDLGGLPPAAHYKVTAQREDSSVEGPAQDVATGNRQLRMLVHDPASLTGRVLLAGEPVPYFGFAITDDPTDTYSRPTPVRDENGRFTHKDATPGKAVVIIVGPGFARKVVAVQIVPGQITDLGDITVERGETIRGRVVDDRGTGIAGATVAISGARSRYGASPLQQMMQGETSATSDASGNYELFGVPPSTEERRVMAAHPAHGASRDTVLGIGQSTVDIVLVATGSIEGSTTATNLSFVAAEPPDGSFGRIYADIDSTGRFSFPALPPGEYDVDLPRTPYPTMKVTVVAGQTATVVFDTPSPPD